MHKFEKKVAIVTGGTRGIGAAITRAFLEQGAQVIATYRGQKEAATQFQTSLGEWSSRLEVRQCDVVDSEQIKAFYQWLKENYSSLDVLVNNAGIRRDQILVSLKEGDWDAVLDTNLKGTYLMSQGAVLLMLSKRFGRIVNISSVGGIMGLPGQASYAASKAGQVALAKSLSKEVARKGITVNNVLPGFIETELISDLPEEQVSGYKKQVPVRRFGTGQEVAAAVLFLASPEASYVTGASLEVTGGL